MPTQPDLNETIAPSWQGLLCPVSKPPFWYGEKSVPVMYALMNFGTDIGKIHLLGNTAN
jgi:hypothetical protein